MRIQQSSFLLICFFFTSFIVRGQSVPDFTCAFDALRNPAETSRMELFEKQIAQYFLQKEVSKSLQKDFSGLPYVVPVVIHIIHDGGAENISDARILAALDHLNEGFAAQGYFAQQGATVHTQIQFCLAKRDPNGNATTGITRTQSSLTNMTMETEDIQTKNLSRWNPKEYVNIWVVKEITSSSLGPGVAGYAYFPSSHGQPQDGMICEARFFGASAADDAVLIHEMGHYFGLYHTFEGGCKNDNCAVDGDRVCDTPPDKATHTNCPFNSCATDVAAGSPFSSDIADFTHDFMDYSPLSCYSSFTAGQATRMQASVETARKSLLFSKGCLDPCTLPIVASFLAAPNPIFAGQSLALTNTSMGGANFSWSDNGSVFSQNQNASLILNTIGNHLIVLNATNADPNCVDTAQVVVQVQCPVTADFSVPQYEIKPGTSLAFTNTSTGGATAFEWSINGVSLATTANFSYLFSTPGYYSVKLQAVGPACGQEKTVQIHVKSFCGEPFFAVTKYSYQKNYLAIYDMVGLPDGSAIQCGKNAQRPMMSRIDAVGNMIWQRTLNMPGSFDDIEPLPDGHFILHGQANGKFLLANVDDSGNLLWFRTLQNIDGVLVDDASVNAVAANPDGSFVFHYLGELGSGIVGKMLADGTLLWAKRYQHLGLTGGLRRATDGSGDILLSTIRNTDQFSVLRINQAGNVVKIYQYTFPQQTIAGSHKAFFDVCPNGDFSWMVLGYKINSFETGVKYLIRCKPNGQPRWAKKIEAPGYNSQLFYARYFPGEGWLLSDNKVNTDKYLIRLDDKDELMWERKIGVNGGWSGDRVYCSIKQNGMIRAMKAEESTGDIHLLQLPDAYSPIACLPDVPQKDVFTNIAVNMVEVSTTVTPVNLVFAPEPYAFLNEPLTRTPSCSLVLSCPESCDNGLDDDQDGLVDCFDTDCKCFDADTLCAIVPPQEPLSVRIAWESAPDLAQEYSTPIVGNLNPQVDSIPEVIVQSYGSDELLIFRGDGSNASNPIHFKPFKANTLDQMPPLLVDINSDSRPELLVATWEGKISVYTNYQENTSSPFTLWFESSPAVTGWVSMLNAADFDHDGIPEIFVGRQVFGFDFTNPAAPTLTRKLAGANHSGGPPGAGSGFLDVSAAADILSKADCNGDPDCDGLELAAGAYIYSVDLDVSDGDGLQIKVQRNLNQLAPGANYSDGFTQIADINLDGTPDVVVNGVKNLLTKPVDGIYVWDKNGLISFLPMYPSVNWKAWGKLTIANVFDDRKAGFAQDFPEIIGKQADSMRLAAFSLHAQTLNSAQPFWWEAPSDDESTNCFVTAFDFNRDGYDELVAKGDHFLQIYYGGAAPFPAGVDPKTRVWAELGHVAATVYDGAIVADADGDHEAEILYTYRTNSPKGGLRVLESAHFPWPTARPIWNQYSYFHAGINDDLSVPRTQQKHWLEMGGIGSGKRPFNTHLAQVASLNPTTDNKLRVPDARISLDSTHCQTDSLEVFLSLCNLGSALLPSGTALAFYLGNPTLTAAPLLFPPLLIKESVERGACKNIRLKIPATYNTPIFAVINDNGSLPRPFNLLSNFPSTSQLECHYENNMISFSFQNQTPPLDLGPDLTLCKNSIIELSANPNFQRYRWQDGSTSPKLTAYTPGKYWVDAFDVCGFRKTDTIHIVLNALKTLNLPDHLAICAGETGQLAASGFSTYHWSPANAVNCSNCAQVQLVTQNSITLHLTAGDANCFVSDSIRIQVHPKPLLLLSAQNGNCEASGSLTASVSGAGPFHFRWSNQSTDSVLNVTKSGTYSVEITDNNGCIVRDSAAVLIENTLKISTNLTEPTCEQSPTGAIDLALIGGKAPFQFLWSNSASSEDLTQVPSGTYSVVVTDANGCTATAVETLTDPPGLQLLLKKTDPSCAGASTGALDLTASGGAGTWTYAWSNSAGSEDLTQVSSGTYSVVVTDANGCTATAVETLTDPPALQLQLKKTDPSCAGASTGALDLTVSGGTGTWTYAWSNSAGSEDLTQVPSGTYSVVVTDANGCTATAVETLTDPPALQLQLKKTDPDCAGASTGALDLTVSGGTGTWTYAWSNSAGSEDLPQVPSGTYSVLVTDTNGCTATAVETLSNPPSLVLNLPKLNLNCPGDQGLMNLTAAGGTPGLSFLWSNGETTEDIKVSNSGFYEVTVTDSKGCKMSASATVSILGASPVLSLTTDTLTCQKTSGLISVTSNLANTSFVWSGPSAYSSTLSSPVISFGGTFSVKATEPLGGCSSVGEVFVPLDTLAPTASIGVHFLEIPCNEPSISIPALGSSSGPGFSNLWTAIAGGSLLSGEQSLSPTVGGSGLYRLSIANLFNGCVSADTVEVVRLAAPEGVAIADSVRCFGEKNGVIQVVSTTGGVPPLSYSIDHQSFKNDPVFENLAAGDYQVFIRDSKGCEFTTEIKVAQPEPIVVDLTGDSTVFQGATVHLKAMVSPAQLVPAHIDWLAAGVNLPNHQLIQSVQLFQSTIFQIEVTDKNGCSASDSWLVKVKKQRRIYAPNIIFPENPGGTNQTFLIFAGEEVSEMESLEIFDRWGNQVFFNHHFQPNEEKEGWSGTFRGKLVDAGVFIWVAKVRLQDGTLEVLDGDLTVIR